MSKPMMMRLCTCQSSHLLIVGELALELVCLMSKLGGGNVCKLEMEKLQATGLCVKV